VAVVVVAMVMVVILVVVLVVVIQFSFHIIDNSHEGQLLPIIKATGQEKYCRIQMIKIEKQVQKKGKKRKRSTAKCTIRNPHNMNEETKFKYR
jgi:outer membrane lipoprotein-sorting protein